MSKTRAELLTDGSRILHNFPSRSDSNTSTTTQNMPTAMIVMSLYPWWAKTKNRSNPLCSSIPLNTELLFGHSQSYHRQAECSASAWMGTEVDGNDTMYYQGQIRVNKQCLPGPRMFLLWTKHQQQPDPRPYQLAYIANG